VYQQFIFISGLHHQHGVSAHTYTFNTHHFIHFFLRVPIYLLLDPIFKVYVVVVVVVRSHFPTGVGITESRIKDSKDNLYYLSFKMASLVNGDYRARYFYSIMS